MYLDYSKLEASQIKQPTLRLQTLAGKELGVIPWVSNLNFELNYADVSRVEFDVPRHSWENQSGLSSADQLQNAVYRTAWYLHSSEAGYIR